ncbi:hypothetical protein FGO68_gene17668 [Halteria grandinella]|uniref:Uncharacterized protein n=1 Tax=Halteria grandinella TaxID=5974 RepID=A0A8J8P5W8_HALGN|nr:hypothetical protein FGO68_gene17668 [Halteria grandinella]
MHTLFLEFFVLTLGMLPNQKLNFIYFGLSLPALQTQRLVITQPSAVQRFICQRFNILMISQQNSTDQNNVPFISIKVIDFIGQASIKIWVITCAKFISRNGQESHFGDS